MASVAPNVDAVRESLARLCARGATAVRELWYDDAAELFESALILAEATHEHPAAAEARAGLAHARHLQGNLDAAAALYARCADGGDDPDPERRELARCRLGFLEYDRGHLELAEEHLRDGLRAARTPLLRGRALGWLGNVARARSDHRRAGKLYGAASRGLRAAGDGSFAVTFEMDRAVGTLLAGRPAAAANDLDLVRGTVDEATNRRLASLIGHYGALARTLLGVPTDGDGLLAGALPISPFLTLARTTAREPSDHALDELREMVPRDAHARITLDIVERHHRARTLPDARGVVVSRSGSFFRVGDGALVTLNQSAPLARLLLALTEARASAPGRWLDRDELAAAAWPGEKASPSSQKNRLHVALSTLRKLGLRPVLESASARYRLSPDASLAAVGAPMSSAQRSR